MRCLPLTVAVFAMLCLPAVASAEIEILNRGVAPNPAVENTQATITVDVRVDRAPYTLEMGCCGAGSLDSPVQLGHNAPKTCLAWRIPDVAKRTSVTVQIQAGRTDLEFGGKVPRTLKAGATYSGPKALRKLKIPKPCASV